jgi:hypothetical protein
MFCSNFYISVRCLRVPPTMSYRSPGGTHIPIKDLWVTVPIRLSDAKIDLPTDRRSYYNRDFHCYPIFFMD